MAKKKTIDRATGPAIFTTLPRPTVPHFDVPCISFLQASETVVIFVINAKRLWDLVQINKREDDKDEGYQRALSPAG